MKLIRVVCVCSALGLRVVQVDPIYGQPTQPAALATMAAPQTNGYKASEDQSAADPSSRDQSAGEVPEATPGGTAPNTPPEAEALGVDATPVMDLDRALGWDWSLPDASNQPAVLKRIETHKGKVTVVEVQTLPAVPGPVTNPPDPPVVTLRNIPAPNVQMQPPPQNPLAGIPQ